MGSGMDGRVDGNEIKWNDETIRWGGLSGVVEPAHQIVQCPDEGSLHRISG